MSSKKTSVAQELHKNRTVVMALLGVPVFGMLIAVAVIYYTKPDNMGVVFGVILFIAVQYILMMFFLMKRIESMAEKENAQKTHDETIPEEPSGDDAAESKEGQLIREEERVFPEKDK